MLFYDEKQQPCRFLSCLFLGVKYPCSLQYYSYIAVMSQSSRISQEDDLARLHVASLTHSEMIMLNLSQLQALKCFTVDLVLSDDEEERQMVAFPQQEHTYLLLVPLTFYTSCKKQCRSFVELLFLCSQTITLPLFGKYCDDVTSLLGSYCINYRYKKGRKFVKIYLSAPCALTYLDFITFQAVHLKDKNCRQLMSLKKANAYQFCLTHFRDDLLPALFTSEEESIQTILEQQLTKIRLLFSHLISEQRFKLVYQLMNEKGSSVFELQKEIEAMVLARHITTVGDEQYETLIRQELQGIVDAQMSKYECELRGKGQKESEFIYVKIVYELLRILRQHNFEINDDKYMFLTSKVVQHIRTQKHHRESDLRTINAQLNQAVSLQNQEIIHLKTQIQALKNELNSRRKRDLSIVIEENEDNICNKRSSSEIQAPKEPVTIKDLKQPLKLLSLNTAQNKLPPSCTTPSKNSQPVPKPTEKKRGVRVRV